MSARTGIARSIGDVEVLAVSFQRHLRAANLSPKTIRTYSEATDALQRFLIAAGMPTDAASIRREHVEAFIEHLLERWKPATASARYRALQQFFKYLVDEGEITESPMARMRPPKIPETPPPVLTDDDLHALLEACEGQAFDDRRDPAILRVLIDTGAPRVRGRGDEARRGPSRPRLGARRRHRQGSSGPRLTAAGC
jgi:site-specific recombinase XerD